MLDYRNFPELSAEFVARHPVDDARFEPWLEAWYGGRKDDPEFGGVAYPDSETSTLFIARAWMMGAELTRRFPPEAIGTALWEQHREVDWYVPPHGGGGVLWSACYDLYTQVFEPNSGSSLGHLNEGSTFEICVYMFWDVACWYAGSKDATDVQRSSFLRICERALASPKASIQESALHGLGHATTHLAEAKEAIERFLSKGEPRRKELRSYAEAALIGGIQ